MKRTKKEGEFVGIEREASFRRNFESNTDEIGGWFYVGVELKG